MTPNDVFTLAMSVGIVAFVIVLMMRVRRRRNGARSGPGAGATGAVYDMLNEDKRRAIEIIAEGRAEATDPETADDKPDSGFTRGVKD